MILGKMKKNRDKDPVGVLANPVGSLKIIESDFPVPFTLQEVREDILTLFFEQARTIGWMINEESARSFLNLPKEEGSEIRMFNPEVTFKDCGLTYSHIKDTIFAQAIESMYLYGYYGVTTVGIEAFEEGGIFTWTSAILLDMNESNVFYEWQAFGAKSFSIEVAKRCLEVAELANARLLLEGGETIHGGLQLKDRGYFPNTISIRELSLLSGMAEMSVRAAANKKRANPLITHSVEGNTRIAIEEAKRWLKSKNLYVNLTHRFIGDDVDLSKSKFSSLDRLIEALYSRVRLIEYQESGKGKIARQVLNDFEFQLNMNGRMNTPDDIKLNHNEILKLANALELDPELLNLRMRESLANQQLKHIQNSLSSHLNQVTQSN